MAFKKIRRHVLDFGKPSNPRHRLLGGAVKSRIAAALHYGDVNHLAGGHELNHQHHLHAYPGRWRTTPILLNTLSDQRHVALNRALGLRFHQTLFLPSQRFVESLPSLLLTLALLSGSLFLSLARPLALLLSVTFALPSSLSFLLTLTLLRPAFPLSFLLSAL